MADCPEIKAAYNAFGLTKNFRFVIGYLHTKGLLDKDKFNTSLCLSTTP
jgi:hypothetical protein